MYRLLQWGRSLYHPCLGEFHHPTGLECGPQRDGVHPSWASAWRTGSPACSEGRPRQVNSARLSFSPANKSGVPVVFSQFFPANILGSLEKKTGNPKFFLVFPGFCPIFPLTNGGLCAIIADRQERQILKDRSSEASEFAIFPALPPFSYLSLQLYCRLQYLHPFPS